MNVRPVDANALVVYLYKATEECIAMEDHVPEQFKEYYRGKMEAFIEVAAHVKRHTPTLDYAPVEHGNWGAAEIIGYDGIHAVYGAPCSECGAYSREYYRLFCSNCGAKMDGGKDDG